MSNRPIGEQAALRAYDRAAGSGKFEHSDATAEAFISGWNALSDWRAARQSLRIMSSPFFVFGLLLAMMGLTVGLGIGWLVYQHTPNLRPNAWMGVPIGLLVVAIGGILIVIGNRRDAAKLAAARTAYDKEWSLHG